MVHFGEWKESVHHEFIVRSRKARVDRKKKEKKVSFFVAENQSPTKAHVKSHMSEEILLTEFVAHILVHSW